MLITSREYGNREVRRVVSEGERVVARRRSLSLMSRAHLKYGSIDTSRVVSASCRRRALNRRADFVDRRCRFQSAPTTTRSRFGGATSVVGAALVVVVVDAEFCNYAISRRN